MIRLARPELWAAARQVQVLTGDGLRSRFTDLHPLPMRYEDLSTLAPWLRLTTSQLAQYMRLVGAAAVAWRWRTSLDGEALRAAAAAIGEPALDALLRLPGALLPRVARPAAERGEIPALTQLGGGLAVCGLSETTAQRAIVRALLPATPDVYPARADADLALAAAGRVVALMSAAA